MNWRPRGTAARRGAVAAPSFLQRRRRDGVAVVRPWRHRRDVVPAAASVRWRVTRARRRHRRDANAGGHVRSPSRERRRLDGVEMDLPSRWCRRTHTHEVAAAARAAAARTTHNTRRRRTSKNTYQTQVRGRLLPPPPLPGQAITRARSSGGLQAPPLVQVFVLAERLRDLGGGRHGRAQAARAAVGHPASAAARAGAADVGTSSTTTAGVWRLLRPAAASVVLRRSAGATAVGFE